MLTEEMVILERSKAELKLSWSWSDWLSGVGRTRLNWVLL